MDAATKAPARICYNSLTDYNQGELVFKWFDLDGVTYEEPVSYTHLTLPTR